MCNTYWYALELVYWVIWILSLFNNVSWARFHVSNCWVIVAFSRDPQRTTFINEPSIKLIFGSVNLPIFYHRQIHEKRSMSTQREIGTKWTKKHDYNFSGGHKNTSLLTIYQTEKSVRFSGNFLPLKSELWRVLYMYVCVKMCHKKAEQQLQQPDKFSGVGPNILKDILCSTPTQHQTPSSLLWDCGSQALLQLNRKSLLLHIWKSWISSLLGTCQRLNQTTF